jgi:hypothetical protein
MVGARANATIKGGIIGAVLIFAVILLFSIIFETNKPMSLGAFFRLAIAWVCIAIPAIFAIIGALSVKMSKKTLTNVKDSCIVSFASGFLAILIVFVGAAFISLLSPEVNISDVLSTVFNPFLIIVLLAFSFISMAGGLIYYKFRVAGRKGQGIE